MNYKDYKYKNNVFILNVDQTNKTDNFANNYKEAYLFDRQTDKSSLMNNEDFSDKKIYHIETKSNSHSFNNSIPKSEINFNADEGNIKNSLGKIEFIISSIEFLIKNF